MYTNRWKSFWAALGLTLLLMLPLVGGTVLLARRQAAQQIRAAESQSGVPIQLPKAQDKLTVLVCVASDPAGFVLAYLNADQNWIGLLALPGELAVPFAEGEASLWDCYAAAGPARCLQGLREVLELPEDCRYLALSPDTLADLCEGYGSLRVGLSGALSADQLEECGQNASVQDWSAAAAQSFLAGLDKAGLLSPETRAAARAVMWDAFFRQKLELLPASLPQGLREKSASLLTDLTAGELYTLEETLEFLANQSAAVSAAPLPGDWDRAAGLYSVNEDSRAAVQALFRVAASSSQSESSSAP